MRTTIALSVFVLFAAVGSAQQTVPFRGDIPIAPQGIPAVPLPDKPVEYHTAEGQDIRVVVVARGLKHPWSLAFLPDGSMLVTERVGQLRLIRNGVLDPQPIAGVPAVRANFLSGLMDIALHPRFAENSFVYLTYSKPIGTDQSTLAVARGRWNGSALVDVRDIFVAAQGAGGASRIAFGRDGTLFMTTGGVGGNDAQDPNSHAGKVLRLRDDGSAPNDNPFVGRAGFRPEVYSLGHRNSLGLAIHPGTGEVWQNENGPNGGDEINIVRPGRNYGWPIVSYGRTYPGPWQSEQFWQKGFEQPVVFWVPSIAISGMTFYTGNKLPKWKGDVFVGGLRTGEIPGTGHLERILFNQNMEELRRESLLTDLRQRIRDVRQGPDELIYALTDADDGAVLRIEPATAPSPVATLAPTGTLRAVFLGSNPVHARVDPQTGVAHGPVADLVTELARKLGVPAMIVPAPDAKGVIDQLKNHTADIGFLAYDEARAREVEFGAAFAIMFNSYLVRADSALHTSSQVDRAGVTVGAVKGQTQELFVSSHLKNAQVKVFQTMPTGPELEKLFATGQVDAFAVNRQRALDAEAASASKLRALPDSFLAVEQSFVVDKGDRSKLQPIEAFVAEVRASGFIKTAIERAKLAGVDVAPGTPR